MQDVSCGARLAAKGGSPPMLRSKDVAATLLTAGVVLVFAATHEGWDLPLVGASQRWAAAAILVLGLATCALGDVEGSVPALFAVLGSLALLLALVALATGSLTALSLLVADDVLLWTLATARHARAPSPLRSA